MNKVQIEEVEPREVTEKSVKELIKQKEEMEAIVEDIIKQLKLSGIGIDTPLVNKDGYPRSDVDVYQGRILRNRLARLRTDLKTITKQIEEDLYVLHSRYKKEKEEKAKLVKQEDKQDDQKITRKPKQTKFEKIEKEPFLIVNEVAPNSPADKCGLQPKDLIIEFGEIIKPMIQTYGLTLISELVMKNENKIVPVTILRNGQKMNLQLIPSRWSGRGLLGCHILEYK